MTTKARAKPRAYSDSARIRRIIAVMLESADADGGANNCEVCGERAAVFNDFCPDCLRLAASALARAGEGER